MLIISDLRMPEPNGMEFIKRIKDMNPFVRTILMTAFTHNDNLFQAYAKQERINGFLQKPTHLEKLCAELNNQLQTRDLLIQKSLIKVP
ncbi:MAG TPA: response regulator [Nitrososphaeraceae archaeon]